MEIRNLLCSFFSRQTLLLFLILQWQILQIIEDQMKRKSELAMALDDMFCEDEKKRINAIKMLDLIASSLGPQRTRDQLISISQSQMSDYLEFNDQDPSIILALLSEIKKIKPYLGGPEYEKLLLNPLIDFCSSDQLQVAQAAIQLIQSILSKSSAEYVDVIKKLAKQQMNVSKYATAALIISGVQKLPHLQPTFVEIFKTLIFSERASIRIIACKHLQKLNKLVKNKEEIIKILQIVYNDNEDLPKLLTIEALISMYPINSNFVMNKLKVLVGTGKWRFDLKLCQYAKQLGDKLNKNHFKLVVEPAFLAMMSSDDIETRSKSCFALSAIAKNMTSEENSTKLGSILEKFASDKSLQVKASFASNLIGVFPYFSSQKIAQKLLPIIFQLLKENKIQISTGIIENFNTLSQQLKSSEKLQQFILKPLMTQLSMQDWRLRVNMINLLGKLAIEKNYTVPTMIDLLINASLDRIEAVRSAAIEIMVSIIKKNPDEWVKQNLIPKFSKILHSANYLIRQKILIIIEKTSLEVGRLVLPEYKSIIVSLLGDRIPNIRILAMKVAMSRPILMDKTIENQISKLKQDSDQEVRHVAKTPKN